jgi:ribonuclease P protein component
LTPLEGTADQRFTPEHHIRFRREFLRVYNEGRRAYGRLAVVFCLPREGGGPWRVGLTVTKKTAGAVMRNLLRRRVREYFRRHGRLPEGIDFVVNLKAAACTASGRELWADLDQILARLAQAPPPRAPEERRDPSP